MRKQKTFKWRIFRFGKPLQAITTTINNHNWNWLSLSVEEYFRHLSISLSLNFLLSLSLSIWCVCDTEVDIMPLNWEVAPENGQNCNKDIQRYKCTPFFKLRFFIVATEMLFSNKKKCSHESWVRSEALFNLSTAGMREAFQRWNIFGSQWFPCTRFGLTSGCTSMA